MNRRFLLLMLCVAMPAFADEHRDIVERAFQALDDDYRNAWAYTETSTKNDVVTVANYDPRQPEDQRWTLVSIDNQPPTEHDTRSFLDEKWSQQADDDSNADGKNNGENEDDTHSIDATIQPDTLTLLEETDAHWLYGFVPSADDEDDDFMDHVDGTLKVVKDGHYVEYMRLQNAAPIKPAVGVKIKTFRTHLTFGPAATDGPIVPKSIDVEVKGRAYLAVKIDESESYRFDNFEFVGDP